MQTERLNLRELKFSDVEKIHELNSLPEVDEFNTLGIPESIAVTRQLVSNWLSLQNEAPRMKYVFVIENNINVFIGLIGINIGKPSYKSAEIWFKLHPKFWNKGYATEAVNRIFIFSFAELSLHRIEAGCAVKNVASKRVLEKVGMIMEGRCRKLLPIRGQWEDNFEFAILETDFEKNQNSK